VCVCVCVCARARVCVRACACVCGGGRGGEEEGFDGHCQCIVWAPTLKFKSWMLANTAETLHKHFTSDNARWDPQIF
jgi:hypothetical protein